MARRRTSYLCRECGSSHPQWLGRCPDCGTWDSLEKFTEHAAPAGEAAPIEAAAAAAVPLPQVEGVDVERLETGLPELDRVLGGGLVAGSIVLVGGDPGVGKSTLLLQAAAAIARGGRPVLYATSEESAHQTRLRAERLLGALDDLDGLHVLADTQLARIVEQTRRIEPAVLVLDSIQMVHTSSIDAAPGSVTQLRRCCTELVRLGKTTGTAIVVVGHVTKDGQLAGPKLLEHLVDAVLSFEGDRHHAHRIVQGIKNRFGTTQEVGLFEMTGQGLTQISQPGGPIDPQRVSPPGSIICPVMHGSRSLLVEVQALTATGFPGSAKRRTTGVDAARLAMLIAVLEKHAGMRLADQDVFASAVGGLKVNEPAADLAIALAIAGAQLGQGLDPATAVVGEVGLGGEVRTPHQLEARLRAAARLGVRRVITYIEDAPDVGLEVVSTRNIGAALAHLAVQPTERSGVIEVLR